MSTQLRCGSLYLAGSLELIRLQILDQNLLLWLNLKKFQEQAQKLCWSLISVDTSNGAQINGLVNEGLR